LFYEKAKKVGNNIGAEIIFSGKSAAEAKKLGDAIPWDQHQFGKWTDFAYDSLKRANRLKYEANSDLKEKLFKTAPLTLVEASPLDIFWGVGLDANDPKIHDKENWRGQNKFGYLLTELRDEMMANEKSGAITQTSRSTSESEDSRGRSKKRTCETTPPIDKPKRTT
jgi:ribA/ribD-fused uncharacterized protein